MLRRARIMLVLLALGGVSCKGDAESLDPNQPAGKVIELAGQVTAARDGAATRPLGQGDAVFADDTVTTGADGSAVILLTHNQVRWSLGQGKSLRVDRSMAWKAKADEGGSAFDDEDPMATASAGRHTDREAGDTAATAQLPPNSKADPAATESAPVSPSDQLASGDDFASEKSSSGALEKSSPPKAKRIVASKSKPQEKSLDLLDREAPGGGRGGGGGLPGGAAAAAPAPPPEPSPAPAPTGAGSAPSKPALTGRVVLGKITVKGSRAASEVAQRFTGFAAGCTGKVPGTLTLRFDIDGKGAVSNLRLTGSSSVLKDVSPCVTSAARGLKFPAVSARGSTSVERELRIEMR